MDPVYGPLVKMAMRERLQDASNERIAVAARARPARQKRAPRALDAHAFEDMAYRWGLGQVLSASA